MKGPLHDAVADVVRDVEVRLINEALRLNDGNVSHAAKSLGVSRKGLQLLMKRHGIEPPNALSEKMRNRGWR